MKEHKVIFEKRSKDCLKVTYPPMVLEVMLKAVNQLYDLKGEYPDEYVNHYDMTFEDVIQKLEKALKGEPLLFDQYEWEKLDAWLLMVDRGFPLQGVALVNEFQNSLEERELLEQLSSFVQWSWEGNLEYFPENPVLIKTDRFTRGMLVKRDHYLKLFGKNGFRKTIEGWSGYMADKLEELGLYQYEEDFYWHIQIPLEDGCTLRIGVVVDPTTDTLHPFGTDCAVPCCGEYGKPYPINQESIQQMMKDVMHDYNQRVAENVEKRKNSDE